MLNLRIISKIFGSLLYLEATLMIYCLLIALGYHGHDVLPFLWSILITAGAGILFRLYGHKADNTLGRRDAYFVVAVVWVLFSLFGTLPYLFACPWLSFTNAFFETMSGFTTTGATILDHPEQLPRGLLFWRSLTQWIGGLGIVFFTVAVLPSLVGGSVKVFAAEATGPIKSKLHPRLSTNSKWLWTIYIVLTVACVAAFKLCGMGWFDACNYAMTSTATGGFVLSGGDVLRFNSAAEDYVCMAFCFLSGINFALLYYAVVKGRIKNLWHSAEFRFYLFLIIGATLFIMGELVLRNGYGLERAFRSAAFQVVSFTTTTGLFNDDAATWPRVTWLMLCICMFFGACSGSTSGGVKSIRGVMLMKVIRNEFRQILHPNAVLPMKIDRTNVPQSKRVTLMAFFGLWLILALVCAFAMTAVGIDLTNAITITLGCLSNVGSTLGLDIGPAMSWNDLCGFAKWFCAFLMLVGRLELFSVLVLFTHSFWKEN